MTDKWVIVGTETCGWCDKVKRLLEDNGHTFTWFNISRDLTLYAFIESSGLTTVPQVYLNGNRLGGYEATKDFLNSLSEGTD